MYRPIARAAFAVAAALPAATLGLALSLAVAAPAHAVGLFKSKQTHVAPPASATQQWYTTPDGCSYSRAKAPGYAPTWHLILNPHHIGQPAPHRGCPAMLRSS